jgi:hypothetical protein
MRPDTLLTLQRAEPLLVTRLGTLQARLQAGDEAAWPEFLAVLQALTTVLPNLRPEAGGSLLTTAEMAARLGVTPKTLLRHRGEGKIQSAIKQGKLLRWSGQERLQ